MTCFALFYFLPGEDSELFCLELGRANVLPNDYDRSRAALYNRLVSAEQKICHALKQLRQQSATAAVTRQEKEEKPESKGYENVVKRSPKREYVEMSPPLTTRDEQNERSPSADPLELLEEDEGEENTPIVANKAPAPASASTEPKSKKEKEKAKKKPKKKKSKSESAPVVAKGDNEKDELELLEEDEIADHVPPIVDSATGGGDKGSGRRVSMMRALRNLKATLKKRASWGSFTASADESTPPDSPASASAPTPAATPTPTSAPTRHREKSRMDLTNAKANATISGYLLKRDRKGRWKRRWCLVKRERFAYAEKESDAQAKDCLSLVNYKMTSSVFAHKMAHVMELSHPAYASSYFAAANESEMNDWVAAIEKSIKTYATEYEVPVEFGPEEVAKYQEAETCMPSLSSVPPALPGEDPFLCRALYDFEGGEKDELIFRKGDEILIDFRDNENWWAGRLVDESGMPVGERGLVPRTYVIKDDDCPEDYVDVIDESKGLTKS